MLVSGSWPGAAAGAQLDVWDVSDYPRGIVFKAEDVFTSVICGKFSGIYHIQGFGLDCSTGRRGGRRLRSVSSVADG